MAGMVPTPLKCFVSGDSDTAGFDTADLEDPSVSLSAFPSNPSNSQNPIPISHLDTEPCDEMDRTKKKRAEMWQDSEMDALVSAYKQVHMKLQLAGKNGKHVFKSANEKWTEVRNLLLPMGVDRQPKEIERKWSNLLTAYKQIVDWNKKVGQPTYWEIDDVLKKEKTKAKELPATFRVQLFESMAEFLGDKNGRRTRSWDPNTGSNNTTNASTTNTNPNHSNSSMSRLPLANDIGPVDVPMCVDKLGSQLLRNLDGSLRRPGVVLVSTGSFNPPTIMHLRMFEIARNRLMADGYNVLGGYMSPVNDGYGKPGLASAEHRIQMCQIATLDSPFIMVDSWEARQPSPQRTLHVLNRIDHAINGGMVSEGTVRVMLLCGADLLSSFNDPGVWLPSQVERICTDHGIVCISRDTRSIPKIVFENEVLFRNQKSILVIEDMAQVGVSSTFIRQSFARGWSVKYLTSDGVIEYVKLHRLYNYRES